VLAVSDRDETVGVVEHAADGVHDGISCLAEGADQYFARAGLDAGWLRPPCRVPTAAAMLLLAPKPGGLDILGAVRSRISADSMRHLQHTCTCGASAGDDASAAPR